MRQPPDDLPISTVEDLDPEPAVARGLVKWRELLLGAFVFVALAGWLGYQWWHQEMIEGDYRSGVQAAADRDWDAAAAYFTAIPGYKDADGRYREAARNISDRDKEYQLAQASAAKQDWATCLAAIRDVEGIQPKYKDSDKIQLEAETGVYNWAVGGTVAARTWYSWPGLYYRNSTSWVRLPWSDSLSATVGNGTPNHFVYMAATQSGFSIRQAILTNLYTDQPTFENLASGTNQATYYAWGEHGIWSVGDFDPRQQETSSLRRSYYYYGHSISYQAFGNPVTSTVQLPGADWAVLAFAPDGEHLLLAKASVPGAAVMEDALYLSSADGSNPRLLYEQEAGFDATEFSPDEHFVLLKTYKPIDWRYEEQSMVLIDTQGNLPPQTLATHTVDTQDPAQIPNMRATFLNNGADAGKVFLAQWGRDTNSFSIIDPYHVGSEYIRIQMGTSSDQIDSTGVAEIEPDSVLVVWQNNPIGQRANARSLSVARVSINQQSKIVNLPLARGERLVQAAVRDDYLLYLTAIYKQFGVLPVSYTVRSLPLNSLDNPQVQPVTLFTTTSTSYPTTPVAFGQHMLAYVLNDRLHARTFDGKIDLLLEDEFLGFYNTRADNGPVPTLLYPLK